MARARCAHGHHPRRHTSRRLPTGGRGFEGFQGRRGGPRPGRRRLGKNYRSAESDPGVCMDIVDHMVNQGWADVYPSVLQARVASELWEASFVAGFGASPASELRREGLLFWLAWFPGCARSSGGLSAATAGRAPPLLVAKRPRNHRLLHICCNFGAVGTHSVVVRFLQNRPPGPHQGTLLSRASASGAPQCIRRCFPLGHRGYSNRRRSTSPVAR